MSDGDAMVFVVALAGLFLYLLRLSWKEWREGMPFDFGGLLEMFFAMAPFCCVGVWVVMFLVQAARDSRVSAGW